MNYIYESIIVGIYSSVIYSLISSIFYKVHLILLFFVVGFIKHLRGYYLSLHEYYCKYKYDIVKSYNKNIILESILEGGLFIIFGYTISMYLKTKNMLLIVFIIGVFLHIIFEIFGIHEKFCKSNIL